MRVGLGEHRHRLDAQRRSVRMIRQAISPRFATRTRENMNLS
jgi:hypothetical protein